MRVLAISGAVLLLSACALSPASVVLGRGSWTSFQHDEKGRYEMTMAVLKDGRVMLVGGTHRAGKPDATTEIYDPRHSTWSTAADMPLAVANSTATVLADGRVLVTGGVANAQTQVAVNTAFIFDPTSETWIKAAPMIQSRFLHGAVRLADGRVLIVGGNTTATNQATSAEIFDPATDKWTDAAPMPVARVLPLTVLLPDGRVVVTGGFVAQLPSEGSSPAPTAAVTPPASLYDPVRNKWSTLKFPPQGYVVKSVFLNNSGQLVGFIRKYQPPPNGEGVPTPTDVIPFVFDVPSGAMRMGAVMPVGTSAQQFEPVTVPDTLLRDGRLLTYDGSRALLYDPAGDSWSVAPSPPAIPSIYGPTSVLLADGRVFITSGNYFDLFDPNALITGPSPALIGSPVLSWWLTVIAALMIVLVGVQFLWSRKAQSSQLTRLPSHRKAIESKGR